MPFSPARDKLNLDLLPLHFNSYFGNVHWGMFGEESSGGREGVRENRRVGDK